MISPTQHPQLYTCVQLRMRTAKIAICTKRKSKLHKDKQLAKNILVCHSSVVHFHSLEVIVLQVVVLIETMLCLHSMTYPD